VGAPASIGDSVTGLHHPTGGLLKVSHGSVNGFYTCNAMGDGKFSCRGAGRGGATFYEVQWSAGVTEPGSSGSGVFADNGHYLLGQLYGGSGTCAAPGADFYGRFDTAYNAGLYQWLGGTPSSTTSTSAPVPTQNYSDMWWNPAESGWGLSLTQHNATIFGAWYIYDASGRAVWLVMPGGQWMSGTIFAGDLYSVTGPDPRGAFDPAQVVRTRAGSATLAFSGIDRATLSYQVQGATGTKEIQRQAFGTPDTTPTANYADLWWNASESGWGCRSRSSTARSSRSGTPMAATDSQPGTCYRAVPGPRAIRTPVRSIAPRARRRRSWAAPSIPRPLHAFRWARSRCASQARRARS